METKARSYNPKIIIAGTSNKFSKKLLDIYIFNFNFCLGAYSRLLDY